MRELDVARIEQAVADLCQEANYTLGRDMVNAFKKGLKEEESSLGREILDMILENTRIASREMIPLCQDTGTAVVFLDVGQEVLLTGGDVTEAVNRGVARGYTEGYLRPSMVADPLRRVNTGDNTPAVLHVSLVPGDRVRVTVAPKGGGSENMSAVRMLGPTEGAAAVRKFVLETVTQAGPNPCPPIVVGVGLGGDFELAPLLAKKALLRPVGTTHADAFYASLEEELLREINREGFGPMGVGGRVTALAVHIEARPCHIASLPVAVNIGCHVNRHRELIL